MGVVCGCGLFHCHSRRSDQSHVRYKEFSEREVLRPGMVRLSFPYFMGWDSIEFVVKAIELVARCGWKLLPQVETVLKIHSML